MTRKQLRDFCLSFPGAVEEFPFGPETHVYKARAKIFAISAYGHSAEGVLEVRPRAGR